MSSGIKQKVPDIFGMMELYFFFWKGLIHLCSVHFLFLNMQRGRNLPDCNSAFWEQVTESRISNQSFLKNCSCSNSLSHPSGKACTALVTVYPGLKQAQQRVAGFMSSCQEGTFSTCASQLRILNLPSLKNQVWWSPYLFIFCLLMSYRGSVLAMSVGCNVSNLFLCD